MWAKSKSIFFIFTLFSSLTAAPPSLHVYVIPFDNIKNDVAIAWLSDAFSEMVNASSGLLPIMQMIQQNSVV